MDRKPNLPRLYELITRDSVDDVLAEATRLAGSGRDEGTLLVADEQTDAKGRAGGPWYAPQGNLHFALIMRPQMSRVKATQLTLVAQVAMYSALAGLLDPGMNLKFRWVNDLLVNDAKLATLNVATGTGGGQPAEFLVLAYSVNINHHPATTGYPATSVLKEQGEVAFGASELLSSFGRHFLSWANRWVDEGIDPIKRLWMSQMSGSVLVDGSEVDTAGATVSDEGDALIANVNGEPTTLSVTQFWDLGELR